jgi:mannosyl-3-phosphoglycerate phosphatase family protein
MTAEPSVPRRSVRIAAASTVVAAQILCGPDALRAAPTLWLSNVMRRAAKTVVFSHVDAVLMHPRDAAFTAARSTLRQFVADGVAVVLCSSKTRAELEFIQQTLGIADPFICEHGAASFIPDNYFDAVIPGARDLSGYQAVEFGRTYADVVEVLRRTTERLRIQIVGFSEMSIEEVARECGLPLLQARLAKLREYEERFRVLDPDPAARHRLRKALSGSHLRCVDGDPFAYVGAPVDHRLGVNMLNGLYRRARGSVLTIGVTDSGGEDDLETLVDQVIKVPQEGFTAGSLSVVAWASAVGDAVRNVRRQAARFPAAPARRDS